MLHAFTALGQSFPYNEDTVKHLQTLKDASVEYAIVNTSLFNNLDWEYLGVVQPQLLIEVAKQKEQLHNKLAENLEQQ